MSRRYIRRGCEDEKQWLAQQSKPQFIRFNVAVHFFGPSRNNYSGSAKKREGYDSFLFAYDKFLIKAVGTYRGLHPEIRIVIEDSSVQDYQRVLNTKLIAGAGPDIININRLPYQKYITKKILADLTALMKNDRSFNPGVLLPNIVNPYKSNWKLYVMPIGFSFDILAGNKKLLDAAGIKIDDRKWTWQDFMKIGEKLAAKRTGDRIPERYAMAGMSAEEFFMKFMFRKDAARYVDFTGRKAYFDSPDVIRLLDEAGQLEEKGILNSGEEAWTAAGLGRCVFLDLKIHDYGSLQFAEHLFGGAAEFFRYPETNNTGGVFRPGMLIGINAKSKVKNEAWELLRILLSDEMQTDSDLKEFPVNRNVYQERAEMAIEETATGSALVTYTNEERLVSYKVKPITWNEISRVETFMPELGDCGYIDPQISSIIRGEISKFFTGERSAKETAVLIQRKVTTYLME